MRSRFRLTVILGFLFWLLPGPSAKADELPAGVLSFDQFTDGYAIDVTNGTQPGGGSPVVTFLDLSPFTLTVDFSDGSSSTVALAAVDPFGDLGTGSIFTAGQVLSATLTGTFSPTTVALGDGSTVGIDPNSVTPLTDAAGPLAAGDFALINVSTQPQTTTPEPGTSLLLATGFLVLASRARSRFRLGSAS